MMAPALLMLVLLKAAAVQAGVDGVWQAEYKTTEGRSHEFTLTQKPNWPHARGHDFESSRFCRHHGRDGGRPQGVVHRDAPGELRRD